MRVIGGLHRGRTLVAPRGTGTRPTSDRTREGIFNMVLSRVDLDGAEVADLFAGSGALGIEALSRGARHVVFVESDRRAVQVIRANLASLGLVDAADVVVGSAERALPAARHYRVVFADPPYVFRGWEALLASLSADLVVAESDREVEPPEDWEILRTRRYGDSVVTLLAPRLRTHS